ncbi:MAG: rhodanese-related sulfurtransferase [Candidatus Phytoplasma cynodontis]|uniref:oxygen-dependent tRNA uridine(34) hydroxylase TrhO n=1 Tax='Cynodon dactylon' phytoplasma TaxID=295320 RepID=UPI001265D0F8|nr:rhodanese-related sulfurtransferase ['Cynodon dactylon' phytoplasma]KAB8121844.1 rhodanese-related sulfurtransferase ['Cynodon dactylon' phytoplasma]WIA07831.1 MAG: rhodanese-related sulfurtransferase [Candidatus Phytoplasma cynodontis]
MLIDNNYYIILFYYYTKIKEPEKLQKEQLDYCKKLGLVGRIIIASEGINGTLSGLRQNIELYMLDLKKNKYFKKIEFKIIEYNRNVFPKLAVKIRKEIVSLKLKKDIFPDINKTSYLEPKQFFNFLKEKKNIFLLDVRNIYEYNLGHFKNAVNPNIENFRDLPKWIEKEILNFKNKKTLLYCTGGVRCEKISALLKEKGVKEVYQLKGGIINYSQDKQVQGELFQGQMYVFDQRIAVKVNNKENVVVGRDYFDQTPCERYINCSNPECNKQILCSKKNELEKLGSCSIQCRKNPKNRFFKN